MLTSVWNFGLPLYDESVTWVLRIFGGVFGKGVAKGLANVFREGFRERFSGTFSGRVSGIGVFQQMDPRAPQSSQQISRLHFRNEHWPRPVSLAAAGAIFRVTKAVLSKSLIYIPTVPLEAIF